MLALAFSSHAGSLLVVCNAAIAGACDVFEYTRAGCGGARFSLKRPDMGGWSEDEQGNLIYWIKGSNGAVGLLISEK